jgi:PAS domain S-box-containing protein
MIPILYVDDEPGMLEAVALSLEDTGRCSVDTALSPGLALTMLNSHQYEAIISDYDMPDMNGIVFLQEVRKRYGDIPFILYTGLDKEEIFIEAINNKANFYLQKGGETGPHFAEMIQIIEQAVLRRRIQRALTESENRYHEIFNGTILGIFRTAPTGRLLELNPAFARMYGYSSPDEMRREVFDAYNHLFTNPENWLELVRQLKNEGEIRNYEAEFNHKDGHQIWVRINAKIIRNTDDTIRYYEGTCEDITDRKAAEFSRDAALVFTREVIQNAGEGITVYDQEFRYLEWNPFMERLFGYTRDEVIGRYSSDIFSNIRKKDDEAILKRVLSGNIIHTEEIRLSDRRPGKNIWVAITYTPHRDGSGTIIGIISLIRDISASKTVEEERIQKNAELVRALEQIERTEEELKVRNEDLSAMNEELTVALDVLTATEEELAVRNQELTEQQQILNQSHSALREANRQLNLLSSITRHDILNKITVLNGYLTLIRDEIIDPKILRYLDATESVTNTIEAQIAFTRIYQDLGTQEPQWIPFSSLISTCNVPGMIDFKTDINSVEIYTDPICGKVFENLLENSIRHGQRVTRVQISHELTPDGMTIIWEDDGVGISQPEKELIFKRGYGKNTGLGLFLVREILSITGLLIQETGLEGKGVRFEIRIPDGKHRVGEEQIVHET